MDLKPRLKKMYTRFFELWQYKIFRLAVIIHLFYFFGSFILFTFKFEVDFEVYYKVGQIFLTNISDLYNQTNYNFPFRYFPLCAIFFIPFTLLNNYELSFVLFNITNLILTIIACVILYKIIIIVRNDNHKNDEKRIITYISLFLMGLPHGSNYVLGQINVYIVILILISLYIFLKHEDIKWQLIGSVLIGISMVIKPITIFLIPFLIVINYDLRERKLKYDLKISVIRMIGVLIPISLNLIIFIMYPPLLSGFIETNISGSDPTIINFSFSITKLFTNFFNFYSIPYNQLILFISIACIIGGIGFLIYFFRKEKQFYIIHAYLLGIIIMLLVYFDSWDHHLLIITPLLIISIFNLSSNSKIAQKFLIPGFFVLNFLNLIFIGAWMLTVSFFPYNFVSTLFLLLILCGIGIYSLKSEIKIQDG